MTNEQAEEQFRELWEELEEKDATLIDDDTAKRTAYNDYTDYLRSDGHLTEKQEHTMPNPF